MMFELLFVDIKHTCNNWMPNLEPTKNDQLCNDSDEEMLVTS